MSKMDSRWIYQIFVVFILFMSLVLRGEGQSLYPNLIKSKPPSSNNSGVTIKSHEEVEWNDKFLQTTGDFSNHGVESDNLTKSKCARYCIKKESVQKKGNLEDSTHRVNLLWTFIGEENILDEIASNRTPKNVPKYSSSYVNITKDTIYKNSGEKCQVFLNLDCDETEDEQQIYNEAANGAIREEELLRENHLKTNKNSKFLISNDTTWLRIYVWGNLTRGTLKIPIENGSTGTPDLILSLNRSPDMKFVRIDARNLHTGYWYLKCNGEETSNYGFRVIRVIRNNSEYGNFATKDLGVLQKRTRMLHVDDKTQFERFEAKVDNNGTNEGVDYYNDSEQLPGNYKQRSSNSFSQKVVFLSDEEAEVMQRNGTLARMNLENVDEALELDDLTRTNDDEFLLKRKNPVVDLNVASNLIATPGSLHRVVFDVTNNQDQLIRCTFSASTSPLSLQSTIQPYQIWINGGQTANIAVDLFVPQVTSQNVITVTLYVRANEIIEKSIYLYVRNLNSQIKDETAPSIEHSFNSNCAGKLDKSKCYKTSWSVDITIKDPDSGLKRVIASPNGLYPQKDFIAGTKLPVTLYYSATCCSPTVQINAIDVLGNYNTRTIDVTAWDNLSEGEIAAITVGAILILVLIILVIFIVLYCVKRRQSHDLPYSQRYRSGPPPRSERTSF